MAVIYRITNMANDHFYIGSAESFERRVWQHKYALRRGEHKNPRLQAAWNKYGEEMFVFEVLETLQDGANTLQIEDSYLMKHVGDPKCYNINPLATAPRLGVALTEATKAAISRARVGKHAGVNHYRYGKQVPPEVRAKIGDAQRGKPKAPGRKVSAEGLAKIRANIEAGRSHKHWVGRTHTEEARAKMSAPVIARAPDGTETRYASITELRSALGLKPPTVNRALKSGVPLTKGPRAGWSFRYVSGTPAKPRKKQQDLAYMHQKDVKATVVAVYTDAPESGTSEWPTELRYSGFRWGRHEVHTDVFWLPEDLEGAIVELILDIKGDLTVYWEQVSRSFPARVVAELRKIAAQLSRTAGRQLPEVP